MNRFCLVCQNVDCKSRGSEELMKELQERAAAKGLTDVEVRSYMCFGACQDGPNMVVYPDKCWYAGVKSEDVDDIVAHLAGGPAGGTAGQDRPFPQGTHLPVARYRSLLTAMEGILFPRGVAEGPEGLDAYRLRGGYQAVDRLAELSPQDVISRVEESGLRGRGGAGFPTGKKFALTLESPETPRYVVMNGGEDEPGSNKDRVLMENVPHLLLEGIILSAYAVQAEKAYLYINHGYEAATRSVENAMREAREAGYWGENIAGSGFSLELVLVAAPSNYVAGEDTAALEVIEGKDPAAPAEAALPGYRPACSASPAWSTTWKPSATSRRSCPKDRNGSAPSAPARAPAP